VLFLRSSDFDPRGKPAERAQKRVLSFVVVRNDVEIIVANERQILFGLNRLKDDADPKFFPFLTETQRFLRIGQRLFGHGDLVFKRLDAGLASDDLVRNLVSYLVSNECGAVQAHLMRMDISEIEKAARADAPIQ